MVKKLEDFTSGCEFVALYSFTILRYKMYIFFEKKTLYFFFQSLVES